MNAITTTTTTEIQATGINADMAQRWINFLDVAPKSSATYTRAIRQFFVYLAENGIDHPTRDTVLAYREFLVAEHTASTVQAYLVAVKLFFKWAASEGLWANIAEHVKAPRISTEHKRDYLTAKQSARLLESIDRTTIGGARDYAILALALTTGLRTISIINADIQDFRPLGDCMVLYHQGKGRSEKAEYVKVAEPVEMAIRAYLAMRNERNGRAPLFASTAHRNQGDRLTTRSVSRIVKEALRGINMDSNRLCAHSLRHTAATLNLLNGGSLEETQQLLGHRNINTTMVYTHALSRIGNQSESRIAGAIFAA